MAGHDDDGTGRPPEPPEQRIAEATLALDDVVSMSGGPLGQFRSYLPGGATVPGVRMDDERIELNVVARYGELSGLGARVAAVLGPLAGGRAVAVTVDDIVLPYEPEPEPVPVVDRAHST